MQYTDYLGQSCLIIGKYPDPRIIWCFSWFSVSPDHLASHRLVVFVGLLARQLHEKSQETLYESDGLGAHLT